MGRKNSGQTLILVVLIMIVALTVGLSLSARTLTNLRLSRQSEESQRAFQAAEAGIEQIIQSGSNSSSDNLANNSSYQTSVVYPSGAGFLLNGGELVDQDVGVDVWLSEYPDFANRNSGSITLYWSTDNQTSCGPSSNVISPSQVKSAIEVIVLSGNKLLPTMSKYFFEANSAPTPCNRISGATAGDAGGTPPVSTVAFKNRKTIDITNGLILRVVPVYNSTKIAVVASNVSSTGAPVTPINLPKQGTIVSSTGKSGQTARKVQYYASYPQIPLEIFPYSLLSQ